MTIISYNIARFLIFYFQTPCTYVILVRRVPPSSTRRHTTGTRCTLIFIFISLPPLYAPRDGRYDTSSSRRAVRCARRQYRSRAHIAADARRHRCTGTYSGTLYIGTRCTLCTRVCVLCARRGCGDRIQRARTYVAAVCSECVGVHACCSCLAE